MEDIHGHKIEEYLYSSYNWLPMYGTTKTENVNPIGFYIISETPIETLDAYITVTNKLKYPTYELFSKENANNATTYYYIPHTVAGFSVLVPFFVP